MVGHCHFKKTTPFCSKPGQLLQISGRKQSDYNAW